MNCRILATRRQISTITLQIRAYMHVVVANIRFTIFNIPNLLRHPRTVGTSHLVDDDNVSYQHDLLRRKQQELRVQIDAQSHRTKRRLDSNNA